VPKIPTSMMTQHPDCASRYIPIQEEPQEAIFGLTPAPEGLGVEEIMIDFEGKLTPYHQPVQVATGLLEKGIVPGRDVFITPRIVSATKENAFRQLMALLSVMETNVRVKEEADAQAVKEVIIPMCESADELIDVRKRVVDVIELAHKEFNLSPDPNSIQLIPLVEEVPELLNIDRMLGEYLDRSRDLGLETPEIRFMIGRSDPALSYGMLAAVFAGKVALAKAYKTGEDYAVDIAPIFGAGSLPFRGHVTLENIDNIIKAYPGVKTITIQSALRYDHGFDKTRKLAQILKERLPTENHLKFSEDEYHTLYNFIGIFTKHYLNTFFRIIDMVCKVSDLMPKQRDRLARISAVGYARDVAKPHKLTRFVEDKTIAQELKQFDLNVKVLLPRVITYTASLYAIGLPPEFIGTGRGLKEIISRYGDESLSDLLKFYPSIKEDLGFAARFVNLGIAKEFLQDEAMKEIEEDLNAVQEILGINIGPQTEEDKFYFTLVETTKPILKHLLGTGKVIVPDQEEEVRLVHDWIIRKGKIRGSLG